jgi:hypothetical protein
MKRHAPWWAALVLLGPTGGQAGEMKAEMKLDAARVQRLRSLFAVYGQRRPEAIYRENDGLRFWLSAASAETAQTGVYSYFALAGDCEVTASYELLDLPPPKSGYGVGVGLAFDAGGDSARGSIQRVHKVSAGSGYVVSTGRKGSGGKMHEEQRFVASAARQGRIGLRRLKGELVFLAADAPGGALQEIARLPFTDRTIRVVRLFADPGGAASALDARLRQIEIRAEEITGGVPKVQPRSWRSWWAAAFVPAGVLLGWLWRRRRLTHALHS